MSEIKTNAMRLLDRSKIPYTAAVYEHEEGVCVDGVTVAGLIGLEPECVFKTLVTRGASRSYFVFVIPVAEELDLKKAAKAVGEKSVEMIRVSEINAVTGYIRGGCSPVGMKKKYKTVFHSSALEREKIAVSAGKIGHQILVSPRDLISFTDASVSDIVRDCSE